MSNSAAAPRSGKELYALCVKRDWHKVSRVSQSKPETAQYIGEEGTPLHVACQGRPPVRVVQHLLSASPEATDTPNSRGELPLHLACRYNASVSVLKALVQASLQSSMYRTATFDTAVNVLCQAEENTETNHVNTNSNVLWIRRRADLKEVTYKSLFWQKIQVLLEAVATHRQYPSTSILYILHAAVSLEQCCPIDVLNYALHKYPDQIGMRDTTGRLPLHIAVASVMPNANTAQSLRKFQPRKQQPSCKLLEHFPAAAAVRDPNEPEGRYPLHTAVNNGHDWHAGVKQLFQFAPDALRQRDPLTQLYPFQMVTADLDSAYQLLRQMPAVLQDSGVMPEATTREDNMAKVVEEMEQGQDLFQSASISGAMEDSPSSTSYYDACSEKEHFSIDQPPEKDECESSAIDDPPAVYTPLSGGLANRFMSLFHRTSTATHDDRFSMISEGEEASNEGTGNGDNVAENQKLASLGGQEAEIESSVIKKPSSTVLKTDSRLTTCESTLGEERGNIRSRRCKFLDRLLSKTASLESIEHADAPLAEVKVRTGLENVQLQRTSATTIQVKVRSIIARAELRQLKASTKIQSIVRGYFARAQFVQIQWAVTKIQTVCREALIRLKQATCGCAASKIQRAWKAFRFCSRLVIMIEGQRLRRCSATRIQAKWRSRMAWKKSLQEMAAIKIQPIARGCFARANFGEVRSAASRIQAQHRVGRIRAGERMKTNTAVVHVREIDILRDDYFHSARIRPWSSSLNEAFLMRESEKSQPMYNKYRNLTASTKRATFGRPRTPFY